MEKITKFEIGLFALLVIYFLFAATNINAQLGNIYAIFALATLMFILLDPKRSIRFKKSNDSTLGSIVVGAGAYVALISIGTFLLIPIVRKAMELLGATTPVLATNPFFQFVTFAIAIPIVETYFFFMVMYDLFASIVGIDIDRRNLTNIKLWGVIIVIALIFMFFHLTAKGIGATDVLSLVFFMAIISMLLVTWFKTGEGAVYFHCIANGIPSLSLIGFSVLNLIGVFRNASPKRNKIRIQTNKPNSKSSISLRWRQSRGSCPLHETTGYLG